MILLIGSQSWTGMMKRYLTDRTSHEKTEPGARSRVALGVEDFRRMPADEPIEIVVDSNWWAETNVDRFEQARAVEIAHQFNARRLQAIYDKGWKDGFNRNASKNIEASDLETINNLDKPSTGS